MTRRLTITIVGVVAGALAVALVGSALLLAAGARTETRTRLAREAASTARALADLEARGAATAATPVQLDRQRARLVGFAKTLLRLGESGIVHLGPLGRTSDSLPSGVGLPDLHPDQLRTGQTVSGSHGSLVYAAAASPTRRANGLDVVVLTRHTDTGRRGAAVFFGLSSLLALMVAAAVAADLGRRLTRPIRDAERATRRIAGGDLAARVPLPGSGDELAALAHSINAMAAALERSRGLERQFLLSVSHDLRTPLTSIRGFAEAIADGRAPDPVRAATIIGAESRRLERLVRDLLQLAELDARRFSMDLRGTDVAEVVAVTVEGFRPTAEQASVVIDTRAALDQTQVPLVSADPDRLAQVVANLVENALKFAAGRIEVGTELDAGRRAVVLRVDDDGPGIAPEDLENVFGRFFSSARTPARHVGTGLGLAIVRELVEAMGGTVGAEPSPLGGARIRVALRPWTRLPPG